MNGTESLITELLHQQGFELVGFLSREDCEFGDWLSPWLTAGHHAEMKWLENHPEIRGNPCLIEGYARSIVSVAIHYKTEPPPAWRIKNPISNYAWGEDYHVVIRKKLKKVISTLGSQIPGFKGRACVDTAPLAEKIIAAKSGLGWIGKNSLLLNRKFGSYLFLAEIVTNQKLTSGTAIEDFCGKCRRCIDACPTNAIIADGVIDSGRCISYLTIEKRGDFSPEESARVDYQLFGCDICQQVCPWNKKQPYTAFQPFACSQKWLEDNLTDPDKMTEQRFDHLKIKSTVKRTKYKGFIRNMKAVALKKAVKKPTP